MHTAGERKREAFSRLIEVRQAKTAYPLSDVATFSAKESTRVKQLY
jgi:hypothetical protein